MEVCLGLYQLLAASTQQSDMGIDARGDLAVELEHEPQHAIGRRMLRTEIDAEVLRLEDCSGILLPIETSQRLP